MSKKNGAKLRRRNVGRKKPNCQTPALPTKGSQERINQINEAYVKKDISELRNLATTGPGLVSDGLRRLCWPLLLHCVPYNKKEFREKHKDEHQVLLDINRSFVHFPKGLNPAKRRRKQLELNDVIIGILRRHPKLSYYQGFHDVCSVLLLVLGNKESAIKAGENIAMFLLRDAMLDSLDPVLKQLSFLNTLIRFEDPEIVDFLENTVDFFENTLSHLCLSWVITWCSHNVRDLSKVVRLFDFFIASDPLITVYLSARVIISRSKELLALERDSEIVHAFLSKFPQHIDIDELILKTTQLYKKYPPTYLQSAAEALDETSCVNLYEEHWLRLKVNEPINYLTVDDILSLPSLSRKPVQIKKSKKPNKLDKKQLVIVLVTAVTTVLIVCGLIVMGNSTLRKNFNTL